ncbi:MULTISPECIES: branched-chain amino acid ABC transporter permease [unclassified Chelatococcus]|uniref:branched-chain amino acid ABC transporter permease n=1 Tax=unclassified Chelatococcus TaxID=2638111 RepID=UPI001BCBCA04|nr:MULTISPECIES: branched-chain amino acid ABC transporter permease [unclassified Chelatococcus]CAH1654412.1 Amino acid/amide ABC transporter membrane protein 1 (HAAT family) [Hyphomicrobiales bacterium]MBS7740248.1 branched-chain amino acid ABC transporter permease [Chelatococcus sp. HY11]MBX3544923.1 branched-chain amino acid ABC transporter permease [Chelatococcus sp.]MCO5078511.1 branched-chain amino acid ABC transporter permease [Chelatococcus sp.]CAH1685422.1 Amino acid/amide ABC transpo
MLELLLQQGVNGLTQGMAYALVALGLTMIFGVLHVINFSHGELYMLGGLMAVVATTMLGLPYGVALILAVIAVVIIAALVDLIAVRPVLPTKDGPSTVLLSTFAVSLLLHQSVLSTWGPNPSRVEGLEGTLSLGSVVITNHRLLVLAAGIVILLAIEYVLRRTLVGRRIRAVAQSEFAAQVVGIDVARIRTLTFLGAAGIAAAAGALIAPVSLFTPSMGQHAIITAFVVVVIGGMGNATGAVVCGLLLGLLEALASAFMPQEMGTAIIYALLLMCLLIRPHGLFAGRAR